MKDLVIEVHYVLNVAYLKYKDYPEERSVVKREKMVAEFKSHLLKVYLTKQGLSMERFE